MPFNARELFKMILVYGFVPFFVLIIGISIYFILQFIKGKCKFSLPNIFKLFFSFVSISSLLLIIWGVFFERFQVTLNEYSLSSSSISKNVKIAVISDTHLGKFKDEKYMQKVVDKINTVKSLDFVLIPGDWTLEPEIKDLEKLFSPLKNIRVPIYGVLGNHDLQQPGPRVKDELESALKVNNVILVDKSFVELETITIAGVGDRWAKEDDSQFLVKTNDSKPLLVLAHNPDSTREYPDFLNPTKEILTVTGHTHCGQVRIPYLYKMALPVENGYFDKGFYSMYGDFKVARQVDVSIIIEGVSLNKMLFITCGVGEVGLPIRLFNPPAVDVIEIKKEI